MDRLKRLNDKMRKAPNFRITKKSLSTAATHIQTAPLCQISGFYTERFGVHRADRQEKRVFKVFWGAKHPIFKLQKNHSLRQQPTYK